MKTSYQKNILCCLLVAAYVFSFTACTVPTPKNISQSTSNEKAKLTYMLNFTDSSALGINDFNQTEFAKQLMKNTDIEIEFYNYETQDEIVVLFASGDTPDILEANWMRFDGGPDHMIRSGQILKLNDIFSTYSPNLYGYLQENPEVDKLIKTREGNYYAYPFLRGDKRLLTYSGPLMRKDWLDELQLDVPETVDEWYNVLCAFRDEKNAKYPFIVGMKESLFPFFGAYDAWPQFYYKDGEVKHGVWNKNYPAVLKLLSQWYKEELLDSHLLISGERNSMDNATNYILSGKSGATVGLAGYTLGYYLNVMEGVNQTFNVEPVPYPVITKGETPDFAITDHYFSPDRGAAITTQCNDVVTAARLLDYAYGEEGHMLFNFGILGKSYKVENNEPIFTDEILNNPNHISVRSIIKMYSRVSYGGPYIQDFRALEQYYSWPSQKKTFEVWENNMDLHKPPIAYPDVRESGLLVLEDAISHYIIEQQVAFITNTRPISEYSMFLKELEDMGIDKVKHMYEELLP